MNPNIIESIYAGETEHILVPEIKLNGGAGLYRFKMRNGNECSSIWKDGEEEDWNYREKEEKMVKDWNKKNE